MESEWLQLVTWISQRTGEHPEEVPPKWEGRRGLNPADLNDKRLMRDLNDLRARKAALEPRPEQHQRGEIPPDEAALYERRSDLASEFLAWYRLNPEAGVFDGRPGMHGVAFSAWPRAKTLPDWLRAVVSKEAQAILARPEVTA
jgi:hypothetical protein